MALVWLLNVYLQPTLLFNTKCVFGALPSVVFAIVFIYLFLFSSVQHTLAHFCLKAYSRIVYLRPVMYPSEMSRPSPFQVTLGCFS